MRPSIWSNTSLSSNAEPSTLASASRLCGGRRPSKIRPRRYKLTKGLERPSPLIHPTDSGWFLSADHQLEHDWDFGMRLIDDLIAAQFLDRADQLEPPRVKVNLVLGFHGLG